MIDYSKFKPALMKLGKDQEEQILTKESILALHKVAIDIAGGELTVRDENLLDSVSVTPYQCIFGEDLYPTLFDKAAKFLFDFCHYQIFVDGNKRTGVLTMQSLLELNGYDINLTNEEVYDLAMDIANNRINEIPDISNILKEKCTLKDEMEVER